MPLPLPLYASGRFNFVVRTSADEASSFRAFTLSLPLKSLLCEASEASTLTLPVRCSSILPLFSVACVVCPSFLCFARAFVSSSVVSASFRLPSAHYTPLPSPLRARLALPPSVLRSWSPPFPPFLTALRMDASGVSGSVGPLFADESEVLRSGAPPFV